MSTKNESKFKGLIDQIASMSVLELSEFVKTLEEIFDIKGMPMMSAGPAAAPAAGAPANAAAEEKSIFNVELVSAGEKRIDVIKLVRDITQKGIADCKALVDSLPQIIKSSAGKEDAENIKKQFEAVGAKVNLQ